MDVQVTIIGLGLIGTSIGLALGKYGDKIHRVGHTRQRAQANTAKRMGAIDKIHSNLPTAVSKADIVILAIPADEVRETLELTVPDYKVDALILNVTPMHRAVADWAAELLPAGRSVLGFTPLLNADFLHGVEAGIEAADADLFRGGLFAITATPTADASAINTAAYLAQLLGAAPLFVELAEADSLLAGGHLMPQLLAAALTNTTVGAPGSKEGRKFFGRAFSLTTHAITSQDRPSALAQAAVFNKEAVTRWLDSLIAELQALRAEVDAGQQEAVGERMARANKEREAWWRQRQRSDWAGVERAPKVDAKSFAAQLFGFGKRLDPDSKR